jgi:DNA polymerase III epsilon subunit-like protein
MYLFFDTETTGLPANWKAPVEDLANWPRMVQAAWILHDNGGNEIFSKNYIVKPEGFVIPETAAKIHGITTEMAAKKGYPPEKVLSELQEMIAAADFLVGHNIDFDKKIVGAEFLRRNIKNNLAAKPAICTMKCAAKYCAIENQYGYKWPKLSELHYRLFRTGFAEAHNASADIAITAKCFWEMKRRGIL